MNIHLRRPLPHSSCSEYRAPRLHGIHRSLNNGLHHSHFCISPLLVSGKSCAHSPPLSLLDPLLIVIAHTVASMLPTPWKPRELIPFPVVFTLCLKVSCAALNNVKKHEQFTLAFWHFEACRQWKEASGTSREYEIAPSMVAMIIRDCPKIMKCYQESQPAASRKRLWLAKYLEVGALVLT